MKNLKYLFIFFFLLSCGYTPIYQTDQNANIKLDGINYSGNKKLGRSIIKGIERFKVLYTEKDGDTFYGQIEYIPLSIETDIKLIDDVQDSYLKILLRYGINTDMEMHMKKKVSYEYVKGIQLPLILKKELINMENETDRLTFIKNIFDNILKQPKKLKNENFPEA